MGRKADINYGAESAVLVLGVMVGLATGSFWAFLITCILFGGLLSVMEIIR